MVGRSFRILKSKKKISSSNSFFFLSEILQIVGYRSRHKFSRIKSKVYFKQFFIARSENFLLKNYWSTTMRRKSEFEQKLLAQSDHILRRTFLSMKTKKKQLLEVLSIAKSLVVSLNLQHFSFSLKIC